MLCDRVEMLSMQLLSHLWCTNIRYLEEKWALHEIKILTVVLNIGSLGLLKHQNIYMSNSWRNSYRILPPRLLSSLKKWMSEILSSVLMIDDRLWISTITGVHRRWHTWVKHAHGCDCRGGCPPQLPSFWCFPVWRIESEWEEAVVERRGNKKQVRWEQASVYAERKWERQRDRSDRERVRLHPRDGERVWRCVAALLPAPLILPSPGRGETASPFPCCTTHQQESVLKWRGVDVKF